MSRVLVVGAAVVGLATLGGCVAVPGGGASVKQVQAVLGHSSAAITLRVYAHLWPGDDDRTRSVMDDALAPLADYVRTSGVVGE